MWQNHDFIAWFYRDSSTHKKSRERKKNFAEQIFANKSISIIFAVINFAIWGPVKTSAFKVVCQWNSKRKNLTFSWKVLTWAVFQLIYIKIYTYPEKPEDVTCINHIFNWLYTTLCSVWIGNIFTSNEDITIIWKNSQILIYGFTQGLLSRETSGPAQDASNFGGKDGTTENVHIKENDDLTSEKLSRYFFWTVIIRAKMSTPWAIILYILQTYIFKIAMMYFVSLYS